LIQFIIFIVDRFVCAVSHGRVAKAGGKAPNISALHVTMAAAWMIRA
jgi:hypothetical protein